MASEERATIIALSIGGSIRVCANVKKCAVNELVLNQDIIAYSKIELEKMNLATFQVNERSRRLQMKKKSNAVMESVVKMHSCNRGSSQSSSEEGSHLHSAFLRLDEEVRMGGDNNIII